MTLLDHSRATERDAAAEAHQKDEKHGLLITKKDAKARPPCPPTKKLRSQAFILDQMRQHEVLLPNEPLMRVEATSTF